MGLRHLSTLLPSKIWSIALLLCPYPRKHVFLQDDFEHFQVIGNRIIWDIQVFTKNLTDWDEKDTMAKMIFVKIIIGIKE